MTHTPTSTEAPRRPFHVMAKPIGPVCNLRCEYCFYLEKEALFPEGETYRIRDEVLESYIRQYIESQQGPEVGFAWQGGEPTLMGLDFFRKVVKLQRKYAGDKTVHNSLQTNGTRLNDEWCRFLAKEQFLVGLSLDGPERIHDRYRKDAGSKGSFRQVMKGLECLRKHGVEFNTLTCVTRQSPDEAVEIYTFLKQQGVTFMQFIPIVERAGSDGVGLAKPDGDAASDAVMPWSVSPEGFGQFLCSIYDVWVKNDVGRIFVNLFDTALSAWCGNEPTLCTYAKRCGDAVALEHDGSIYSCDHYVYPSHRLGSLMEQPLSELVQSDAQQAFGTNKETSLPDECRECAFLFACNGDCPKHRFADAADGSPGLSYLCAGFQLFFAHIDPTMRRMADLVKEGRPAADIMGDRPAGGQTAAKTAAEITVNGEPVSEALIRQEYEMLRERYGLEWSAQELERQAARIASDARENSIERVLLQQQARAEIGELRPEEVNARCEAFFQQHGGEEEFMRRQHLSPDDVRAIRQDIEAGLRLEKLYDHICADLPRPTGEDSRAYYEAHPEAFRDGEQVRVSHIVMQPSPSRPAGQVYARLLNLREELLRGADFEKLAVAHSDCPDKGGDLGFFGRGAMEQAFEKVAFATPVGELSDVFQTRFGYHLLKVTDHQPGTVASYDDVRYDIEAMLFDQRKNEAIGAYVDQLREGADIQFRMPNEPSAEPYSNETDKGK